MMWKSQGYYEDYIYAFAALEAFIEKYDLKERFTLIPLVMDRDKNLSNVLTSFRNVSQAVTNLRDTDLIESARFKYKAKFDNVFAYKFSDGDVSKIKELIGELRDSINSNGMLSENHRKRLLFKLESLDKEFHKNNERFI